MKKQIIVCITLFTLTQVHAQDTMHIKMGFMFNPQASVSLQNPAKGFSAITPILFVTQFTKGTMGINVMYSMTYNNIQGVYFNQLSSRIGYYLLANKHMLAKGGYASVGLTRGLAEGRAVGFIEFGSSWDQWAPVIYTGLIIPFTLKLK